MRILLLQAYLGRREPPVAPLGLATLAAALPDHELRIFDPNVAAQPWNGTAASIEDFQPDLIGVSLRNIDTTKYSDAYIYFEPFRVYLTRIRQLRPDLPIAVGGSGFALFPRAIMRRCPEITWGFLREAENSFRDFLDGGCRPMEIPGVYYRADGEVVATGAPPPMEIGSLAFPRWDLVNLSAYLPYTDRASVGLEAKRGCAMNCSYCTYPQLGGETVRLRSPARVVDDLERLQRDYGVDRVFFTDPVFNFPPEHAVEICGEILKRGVEIQWRGYHQDHFLTREYLDLAVTSGCDDFYFSPDAASARGCRALGKATTPESLRQCLELIHRNGKAKASFSFFAAAPGNGWKDFLAAARFILRAKHKLGTRMTRWKFGYIRPEPNTPLAKMLYGENASSDSGFLLPKSPGELRRLFVRRGASRALNALLALHFRCGWRWGRRNVLPHREF